MTADLAKRFVVGKLFTYSCFDGTRGAGRIYDDGSVAGSIQVKGNGPMKFVSLPAGTLKVKGQAVCAAVRGLPFEPCFNLTQTNQQSFRGAVSGLNFAYCDFVRRDIRQSVVRTTWRQQPAEPLAITAAAAAAPAGN
jgi:hypothetical protein